MLPVPMAMEEKELTTKFERLMSILYRLCPFII